MQRTNKYIQPYNRVVPKSYQREGQPHKTENELTNIGEDGSKPNPNPNTRPNPKKKKLKGKKLRKRKKKIELQTLKRTVPRTITQPTVLDGNSLQIT